MTAAKMKMGLIQQMMMSVNTHHHSGVSHLGRIPGHPLVALSHYQKAMGHPQKATGHPQKATGHTQMVMGRIQANGPLRVLEKHCRW